jgi:hypothetical protein
MILRINSVYPPNNYNRLVFVMGMESVFYQPETLGFKELK